MTTFLFVGGVKPLPPENRPSGIAKTRRFEPLWLDVAGIAGDQQADRRVHGGPDKALHQFPPDHYPRLAAAFPEAAATLCPGSLGENLSVPAWDESTVCIGDVFVLGDARIQVSQPRSPCWKIDARQGVSGMARWIVEHGTTGWYFRVLEAGQIEDGCQFELLERPAPAATLARLWQARHGMGDVASDPATLRQLADAPGLVPAWRKALLERLAWREQQA